MCDLCLIIYRKKKLTMIYWYQLEDKKQTKNFLHINIVGWYTNES